MEEYRIANSLVLRYIQKLQLEDYHLEVDDSSATANGYLGAIFFVKVVHKKGTLNLVVKAGCQNANQRNFVNVGDIFGREIYFYKEVVPAINNFQWERVVKQPFVGIPKCYETYLGAESEGLILENLKTKGFKLWSRFIPMDESHIKFAVKEYGKLHAISFAMKDQNPEKFKQLTKNYHDTFKKFLECVNAFEPYRARFRILSEVLKKQRRQELADKVHKFIDELEPFLKNCADPDDLHSVILHGDCWCNNMMFKYEVISSCAIIIVIAK